MPDPQVVVEEEREEPEIASMLTASTGHITREENETLFPEEAKDPHNIIVYDLKYGWLLYVSKPSKDHPDWDPTPNLEVLSEGARAIVALAQEHGCLWVKFDRDGPLYESLPNYSW